MSQTDAAIVLVAIGDLRQSPDNPRRINDRDFDRLRRSIREDPDFMRLRPVLARPDGTVYAGNMRLEAARAEGWTEVPTIYTDDPEAVIKARAVKDNASYGEWVAEDLAEYLDALGKDAPNLDFGALGLDDNLVRTMGMEGLAGLPDLNFDMGPEGAPGTEVGGVERPYPTEADRNIMGMDMAPPELDGALRLAEDVRYRWPKDAEGEFGIPLLRKDRMLQALPEPLTTWAGGDAHQDDGSTFFVYNYSPHKPTTNPPLERCILSFFTGDRFILPWLNQPAYYVGKMLNAGIRMAIEPDVSPKWRHAPAVYTFNLYRARWLARYMQDAGIAVIPRMPYPQTDDEFSETSNYYRVATAGFPKHAPIVAMNAHSGGSSAADQEDYALVIGGGVAQMFEDGYRCDTLLVYGDREMSRMMVEACKVPDTTKVIMLPDFLTLRRQFDLPYRES